MTTPPNDGRPQQPDDFGQAGPVQQPGYPQQQPGGPQDQVGYPGAQPDQSYQQAAPHGEPGPTGQFAQPGQFGQQGTPDASGAFGAQGGQDDAAARVRQQRKTRLISAIVTVALVVAGIVFFIVRNNQTSPTKAAVGSCIEVEDASDVNNVKSKQQDCNDMAAAYVVTETGEGVACDPSEDAIEQEGGVRVCLRPNVKSNDCVALDGKVLKKIDCASAKPDDVKVVLVQEGTSDASACPAGSQAQPLAKRNILYCLAPAKG